MCGSIEAITLVEHGGLLPTDPVNHSKVALLIEQTRHTTRTSGPRAGEQLQEVPEVHNPALSLTRDRQATYKKAPLDEERGFLFYQR